MSLHKTQTTFKNMILTGKIDAPDTVFQIGGTSLEKRLHVYQNNYHVGLSQTLSEIYQTITDLVGKSFMKEMCKAYALQYPPQKACLYEYGEAFPDFIKTFESAQSLPYLTDMARLDWAANIAYHAPDLDFLTPHSLAEINLEENDFKLTLHPSTTLLHSSFPITDIRHYVRDHERQKQESFHIEPKETYTLITRKDHRVITLDITASEYNFLTQGTSLIEALEMTLELFQGFDFQALLQKTISYETFLSPNTNRKLDT